MTWGGDDEGMDPNTLFTMALGLQAPWEVKSLQFSAEDKRLDILVDFERGATFPCPECGKPAKAHDTEEKTWRHLDFFQHAAYLTARVPRCKCDEHGVKQVVVPPPDARDACSRSLRSRRWSLGPGRVRVSRCCSRGS